MNFNERRERRRAEAQALTRQRKMVSRSSAMIFLIAALVFFFYNFYAPSKTPSYEEDTPKTPEARDEYYLNLRSQWNLLLVNDDNPLPEDFAPELETLTGRYQVDARIAEAAKSLITDAQADGIVLQPCSAYRSAETQKRLFDEDLEKWTALGMSPEDSLAKTKQSLQEPGKSEHQTGLAIDFITPSYTTLDDGFENTDAFRWLSENAVSHGFILRYPKDKYELTKITYEPWHYRYVGQEYAEKITAYGLCLEEFLGGQS